jgi:Protein of unknown function (DUF3575)
MLVKKIISLAFLWSMINSSFAQEKKITPLPAHFKIRISPLALLEPEMQLTLGTEWRFNDRFSIGLDASWIFWNYINNTGERNYAATQGYKIRPEFRYYFKPKNDRVNWFAAFEASYKRTVSDRTEEVCVNQGQAFGCSFIQQIDYKEVVSTPGGAFKIGYQEYFSKSKRVFYELFLGLGVKNINKMKKGYTLPQNASNAFLIREPYGLFVEGFAPHIPAGIKIGMRL